MLALARSSQDQLVSVNKIWQASMNLNSNCTLVLNVQSPSWAVAHQIYLDGLSDFDEEPPEHLVDRDEIRWMTVVDAPVLPTY